MFRLYQVELRYWNRKPKYRFSLAQPHREKSGKILLINSKNQLPQLSGNHRNNRQSCCVQELNTG